MLEPTNMGISLEIIEGIFLFIIGLIVIVILLTYLLTLELRRREKKIKKISAQIENYFVRFLESRKPIDIASFPHRFKKVYLLYPIFFKLDKIHATNPHWQENRMKIIESLLLPLARKRYRSLNWTKRFLICELFSLIKSKQDEKIIIKYANDKIPLVFIHSVPAAIKNESEKAINRIIDRLAKLSHVSQLLYVGSFKNASPQIQSFIERRLSSEKNPKVRAMCYTLLSQFPPSALLAKNTDLQSDNLELRQNALKYAIHVDQEESVSLLMKNLDDPNWEVRSAAIHELGAMKIKAALPKIVAHLDDENWQVKLSVADALRNFGEEGHDILKTRAPELLKLPSEASTNHPHPSNEA